MCISNESVNLTLSKLNNTYYQHTLNLDNS
ncbi:hypothetical protein SAMN05443144_12863 [Fodinibius roseus]|uniref:Uncharacterized protein n=1 Tax=Fodinibius roseus TaxID=1194090 RepID=A0A1M5JWV1_9BACT|nr:hypothetical protein SAMN05443144_12863 [Fodinibius roseus]